MGYRLVDPDEVEPEANRPSELHRLSDPAGLEHMSVNMYRAEPGEQLPMMYHSHDEQEEAFYVIDGTLHVETPDRTYQVETGSMFAVDPESPHRAFNPPDADASVSVLALGAPAVSGDARKYEQ